MTKKIRFDPPDLLPILIDPKGGDTPFILAEDLHYSADGVRVTVPKDFKYDMASIPPIGRVLISKTDPRIVRAATVHDQFYKLGAPSRRISDAIFLDIMKYDGMPWIKRMIAYAAVRLFGFRNFGKSPA